MKALVLSGGAGTRLRPITHTSAKQLVPVANKPVLFYGLEAIRDAGVTDVGIVVGDTAPEVMAAVGDGAALGIKVTYLPQEKPLGLAHAVLIARDFLGEDPFVMYLGDNFLLGGIRDLVSQFDAGASAAQILLTQVSEPRQFGIAVLDDDGKVKHLIEKPKEPPSDLALVGVYMFRSPIHEAVRAIKPSGRGELEITDAIQWLIDQKLEVDSFLVTGYWKDTGKLDDMLECNRAVLAGLQSDFDDSQFFDNELSGELVLQPGAEVRNSQVVGPVIIGSGSQVKGSKLGPNVSIAGNCTIENAEIEDSIVLEGSTIIGLKGIKGSLIGKEVLLKASGNIPVAVNLMIGDHSQITLGS